MIFIKDINLEAHYTYTHTVQVYWSKDKAMKHV